MRYATLFLIFIPSTLLAQVTSSERAVIEAAIDVVRDSLLPGSAFTLDPAYRANARNSAEEGAAIARGDAIPMDVARAIGAVGLARLEDAVVCQQDAPPSCRMRLPASAALAVSIPAFAQGGDAANILVTMKYDTASKRVPVTTRTVRVRLFMIEGQWKVVGIDLLSVT